MYLPYRAFNVLAKCPDIYILQPYDAVVVLFVGFTCAPYAGLLTYKLGRGACDSQERERSGGCVVGINRRGEEVLGRSGSGESEQVSK